MKKTSANNLFFFSPLLFFPLRSRKRAGLTANTPPWRIPRRSRRTRRRRARRSSSVRPSRTARGTLRLPTSFLAATLSFSIPATQATRASASPALSTRWSSLVCHLLLSTTNLMRLVTRRKPGPNWTRRTPGRRSPLWWIRSSRASLRRKPSKKRISSRRTRPSHAFPLSDWLVIYFGPFDLCPVTISLIFQIIF